MASNYRKDVEAFMRVLVKDHGCSVITTGRSHYRITGPDGTKITCSRTPNYPGTVRKIKSDVRRHLGIEL